MGHHRPWFESFCRALLEPLMALIALRRAFCISWADRGGSAKVVVLVRAALCVVKGGPFVAYFAFGFRQDFTRPTKASAFGARGRGEEIESNMNLLPLSMIEAFPIELRKKVGLPSWGYCIHKEVNTSFPLQLRWYCLQ